MDIQSKLLYWSLHPVNGMCIKEYKIDLQFNTNTVDVKSYSTILAGLLFCLFDVILIKITTVHCTK